MRKRTLAVIIFSLLLCGCNFGQGNNDVSETTSAASETTSETAVTEVTEASGTETEMTEPFQAVKLSEIDPELLAAFESSVGFGSITDLGGGVFSAPKFDRDGGDLALTWKDYWFYFEDGEFKEFTGEKITKADFMQYTGGKAVLDKITAEGGEVTDILYRKNNIVNVNYTIAENGVTFNKFLSFDVSGGDCKEVRSVYENQENNYGVYLPSVLNPYTEEQLALHEVIKNFAGEKPDGEILNTLFGDLDGDGRNELIAVYGQPVRNDLVYGTAEGELWFASGSLAFQIGGSDHWFLPRTMVSAGQVIVNVDRTYALTETANGSTVSFLIKGSSASEIESPHPSGLAPDGKYGDLISTGAEKEYWYYFLDNKISEYYGAEITTEDFLKYDGAEKIIEDLTYANMEVRSILKRGNGIINISYGAKKELIGTEGFAESFASITVRYRNGKVFVAGENKDIYLPVSAELSKAGQSDFEKFSEMIYDTTEGDENSVLLERFFGDTNSDGKSELYAYYGTEESFSLWYADEKGAEKCEEDYQLLTLEGDILLKKSRSEEKSDIIDYYIMRNGRTRRLNAYDAKNMTQTDGNDFSGYITAADAFSDGSGETTKEYWFYYRNSAFNEYGARLITEEELSEYKGARAFLDEISSMGGDVKEIILRDNGIININYDAHMQELVQHYYLTLQLDDKDRPQDITPRNEDGTLNNKGYYLLTLK